MDRTDLFIVSGADLEYTKKKILLKIHGGLCSIKVYMYISKEQKLKTK